MKVSEFNKFIRKTNCANTVHNATKPQSSQLEGGCNYISIGTLRAIQPLRDSTDLLESRKMTFPTRQNPSQEKANNEEGKQLKANDDFQVFCQKKVEESEMFLVNS